MSERTTLVVVGCVALAAVNVAAFIAVGFWGLFVAGASVPVVERLLDIVEKTT